MSSTPSKPWFMWFCPGANHAPHHAPQEYIDKYKGVFDDGYEAYREWVLAEMVTAGHVYPCYMSMAELDALQAKVVAAKMLQAETAIELDALLPAILDRAFKGELV